MSTQVDVSLRPNGLGGYIVRQSDLASWSRCNLQKHYLDVAKIDPDATQPESLSATEYGSVLHYALLVLERLMNEDREDALQVAIASFEHYWNPDNIEDTPGGARRVTTWLPRQSYGGLRERGRLALSAYYDQRLRDEGVVLALEYTFTVPLCVNDVVHTLTGTVDRLSIRRYQRKPYVSLDDFKTGRQPTYLRHNVQGTAYSYASTQPEFWRGAVDSDLEVFPEDEVVKFEELFEGNGYSLDEEHQINNGGLPLAARKFRWINLKELKVVDGGWRAPRDYARLRIAVDAYVRANRAGIFMPTMTGEVCFYCAFNGTCAGTGIPDEKEGQP